jgi:hypothetical protein
MKNKKVVETKDVKLPQPIEIKTTQAQDKKSLDARKSLGI